jgi:acetyl-CoA synthetase
MVNSFDLAVDTVFWTPVDWASMESLFGVIYPALYYGVPIVAGASMDFDGDGSNRTMAACEVTTAVLTAAQLRSWKRNHPNPRDRYDLKLRGVVVTNAGPTQEMIDWARTELNASLQSDFIDVGAGPIAASCERWFEGRPETAGRVVPGRTVEILDGEGAILPRGSQGRIAVQLPDQSVPVDYLDGPRETN